MMEKIQLKEGKKDVVKIEFYKGKIRIQNIILFRKFFIFYPIYKLIILELII